MTIKDIFTSDFCQPLHEKNFNRMMLTNNFGSVFEIFEIKKFVVAKEVD